VELQHPTTFDAWTGAVSAVFYLAIGIGAVRFAPADSRTRTFFTIALASLAPYLLPALLGRIGYGTTLAIVAVATGASLAVGSIALFHFTQVFPLRRPWIRARASWLLAAYVILPPGAAIGALALLPIVSMAASVEGPPGSGGLGVSSAVALVLLVVVITIVFVIGAVLPFAAVLSLYKSWQEAKREHRDGARVTTLTILISQLAGGVLTILIVPLLHLVAPASAWVTGAATMLFGVGLLFPVGFAVGVWKYRLILQPN